ncbi:2'-5' RNA ligase [Mobilisporobacter senegalensis]|uniref:2'-5' RNA ligase n=1 Tax=Mobilisporobacter senegalensis TaxID=1329262 RepID=A0A3N1Y3I9_9FIRM|nr:2'-5' RNA ligase family protein [Mobilisporobacter senegalensis]ROR31837.1 2'-5' RNA ligase [Mobilisporobacter senegalensis]
MRLFIAILFHKEVKDYLKSIMKELKESSLRGNFVDYNNLHLTLVFLGELESDRKVRQAMELAVNKAGVNEFPISINGLGNFKRREDKPDEIGEGEWKTGLYRGVRGEVGVRD